MGEPDPVTLDSRHHRSRSPARSSRAAAGPRRAARRSAPAAASRPRPPALPERVRFSSWTRGYRPRGRGGSPPVTSEPLTSLPSVFPARPPPLAPCPRGTEAEFRRPSIGMPECPVLGAAPRSSAAGARAGSLCHRLAASGPKQHWNAASCRSPRRPSRSCGAGAPCACDASRVGMRHDPDGRVVEIPSEAHCARDRNHLMRGWPPWRASPAFGVRAASRAERRRRRGRSCFRSRGR